MFIRMPYPCVVDNCWPAVAKRLLRFPKDRAQQIIWLNNLNIPHLLQLSGTVLHSQKRVCDLHFRAEDIIPQNYPGSNNRALRRGSVPIAVQREVAAVASDVSDVAGD